MTDRVSRRKAAHSETLILRLEKQYAFPNRLICNQASTYCSPFSEYRVM